MLLNCTNLHQENLRNYIKVEIILASYNPDPSFFSNQIQSILNQTYPNWSCHIIDDSSSPQSQELITSVVNNNSKFRIYFHEDNLGAFYNFERGLSYLISRDCLVALSDQDDIWEPEKLEKMVSYFNSNDINLVHTDLSLITPNGKLIHFSCWAYEQRNPSVVNIEYLLARNCITGCSLVFSGRILPYVLPFPRDFTCKSDLLHDWWIGLIAISTGQVISVNEKLTLYRQHNDNIVGAMYQSGSFLSIYRRWSSQGFRITDKGYLSYQERWRVLSERLDSLEIEPAISNIPSSRKVNSTWYLFKLYVRSVRDRYGGSGSFLRLFIVKLLMKLNFQISQ